MNLKTSFVLHFSHVRIGSLPKTIFDFEQYEKESIGAAWDRFSKLIYASPDLSLPDNILLWLFCLGIDIEANLCLDMTAGGRFTHKTMMEQVEFIEHFMDKHAYSLIRTKPL